MSFHVKTFSESTGLTYDKKQQLFYGSYNGYPVFLKYVARRGFLLVHLYAKPHSDNTTDLNAWLSQWQVNQIGISNLEYSDRRLSGTIAISARDSDLNAVSNLNALLDASRQIGLIPCCAACGTEIGCAPYSFHGVGFTFCPPCSENAQNGLIRAAEQQAEEPQKPLAVLVGLTVCFVSICLIVLLLWNVNIITYISGYLGIVFGLLCLNKLRGKLTVLVAIAVSVVALVASVGSITFCFAKEIADQHQEALNKYPDMAEYQDTLDSIIKLLESDDVDKANAEKALGITYEEALSGRETIQFALNYQSTADCLKHFPTVIKHNSKNYHTYLKNIIFSAIIVLAFAADLFVRIFKKRSGNQELRRLEE